MRLAALTMIATAHAADPPGTHRPPCPYEVMLSYGQFAGKPERTPGCDLRIVTPLLKTLARAEPVVPARSSFAVKVTGTSRTLTVRDGTPVLKSPRR